MEQPSPNIIKTENLSKPERIVITTILSLLFLAVWTLPLYSEAIEKALNFDEGQLEREFTTLYKVFISFGLVLGIYFTVKNTGYVKRDETKSMKFMSRWFGWDLKYSSVNFKIAAVVSFLTGIYFLFTSGQYWWIGLVLIILAPLLWFISKQYKRRSEIFMEAGRK